MQNSYPGNLWSQETAAMLGYSSLGKKPAGAVHCKSYGKHFPYGCMLQVFLFAFLLFFDLKLCNPCGKSL